MSVFFLNSLSNGEYLRFLNVAVFPNSPSSIKTYSLVENSFLQICRYNIAKISAVSLSKLY